jgi:hypothetical protein
MEDIVIEGARDLSNAMDQAVLLAQAILKEENISYYSDSSIYVKFKEMRTILNDWKYRELAVTTQFIFEIKGV